MSPSSDLLPEPLLADDPDQFSFVVKHQDLYRLYQEALASFWTPHEINLDADKSDLKTKLTEGDKRVLLMVLAFFAEADGIVNMNLVSNFYLEVQSAEAKAFYAFQTAIEAVHAETYANMLHAYVDDEEERYRLLRAVRNIPCVGKKAKWALQYMDRSVPFAEREFGFAIMEGIFFSAAFCVIFYLKKRGLMPGLTLANSFISRDEGLHCRFACALFLKCANRPSQERIHQMMQEALVVEESFVRDAIPIDLIGLKADEMVEYVKYCADRLLKDVGYDPIWNAKNPFDFMTLISVPVKTNFFENLPAEYNKSGVHQESKELVLSEDF